MNVSSERIRERGLRSSVPEVNAARQERERERAPVREVNTATEERILVDRVLMREVWTESTENVECVQHSVSLHDSPCAALVEVVH